MGLVEKKVWGIFSHFYFCDFCRYLQAYIIPQCKFTVTLDPFFFQKASTENKILHRRCVNRYRSVYWWFFSNTFSTQINIILLFMREPVSTYTKFSVTRFGWKPFVMNDFSTSRDLLTVDARKSVGRSQRLARTLQFPELDKTHLGHPSDGTVIKFHCDQL